jgi:hypothetical protein
MADLPQISELSIDICSVGRYKLAVFPCFLALGIPVWNGSSVIFNENSYIKISEYHLSAWLLACISFPDITFDKSKSIGTENIISYEDCGESDEENSDGIKKMTNLVSYIIQEDNFIQIKAERFSLQLNEPETSLFVQAFKTLFFKVFCYHQRDNNFVFMIIQKCSLPFLENDSDENFENLRETLKTLSIFDSHQLCFYPELIRRHREILSLYKVVQNF